VKAMLRKTIFLGVVLFFCVNILFAQTAEAPSIGDGSPDNPYQIATLANLRWLSENSDKWASGICFIQTADIDASETQYWNDGVGFSPIGISYSVSFRGNYNGNGHSISGLYINRPTASCIGLFGSIGDGAEIRNLGLIDIDISGQDLVGGLIGENVFAIVSNCYACGLVSGEDGAGGLIGYSLSGSVSNCYASGQFSGTASSIGGLIGFDISGEISNCYADGLVSGVSKVGGFIGENSANISSCYASGEVTGSGSDIGGFLGDYKSGTITACFWDQTVNSGLSGVGNEYSGDQIFGKTTAEMQTQSTYSDVGWKFMADADTYCEGEDWYISVDSYPVLTWQAIQTVSTLKPTDITETSATLNGRLYANGYATIVEFEWGTTEIYGNTVTVGSYGESDFLDLNTTISDLDPNTFYHYRIKATFAENSISKTAYGIDRIFFIDPIPIVPSAGDGSPDNPYQIANLANLRWLSENADEWVTGIYFIQTADIDASETQYWNDGVGFSPIGNSDTKFEGNYNGSGHTISGLFINRPDESYIGLFGYTSGSEIKNLGISDVNITCNESSGSLVGYNSSSSIIKCYSKGNISGKGSFVGGLVGSNSNSTISGSYSTGNVTSESFTIGGLIGYNSNFSNIEYCFSSCNVTGRSTIGGLIGSNNSSTVNNSYSFGNATGKRTVGGFIGWNIWYSLISNCYSRGIITRDSGSTSLDCGGFIGDLSGGEVLKCYATGSVHYEGEESPDSKGFAGYASTGVTMASNFWDTEASGQASTAGNATGIITSEMKTQTTFTDSGWDFIETWSINDTINDGYPYLLWFSSACPIVGTISIEPTSENCALIHCQLTDLGNPNPFQHGVCWSTSIEPKIDDNKTELGEANNTGSYNSEITGLSQNTVYYVRAYATNAKGTVYGGTLSFMNNPNVPSIFHNTTNGSIEGGLSLIDDNALYAVSSSDGVYRYNTEGVEAYKLSVGGDIKSSTTITPDHKVYISSTDNNLYSFNSNGVSNQGWPVSLGAQATASVSLGLDGEVYIGTSNGIFQSILPSGSVLWAYNVGAAVYSSAVISADNILYVVNTNGRILAFDLNTLNPVAIEYAWRYELEEQVKSSPALDDQGNLYVTTLGGKLNKLNTDVDSATVSWVYSIADTILSSPIVGSDYTVYFGSTDGFVYAIDQYGELKWKTHLGNPIKSTAALAEYGTGNDRLYIGDLGGYLNTLLLSDGSIIKRYRAYSPIQCPILYKDSVVYFGTMDGDVFAIPDTVINESLYKRANISVQWPTFQANNQRTGTLAKESVRAIGNSIPTEFILSQNYPNPFNPTTTLQYGLPEASDVKLMIYDITGRKIKQWSVSNQQPGWHEMVWNGTNQSGQQVSTGVYIYSLRAGNFVDTKKMVFMK